MKSTVMLDGMKIAYQQWGKGNGKKVLLLHGWLDNSNSFRYLGPHLADKGFDCLAIDHIGHGWSSHLPKSSSYTSPRAVGYIREVVDNMAMDGCHLVGHSMGANLGFVYAGVFPETIDRFVMIDGLGPPTIPVKATAKNLRKAFEAAHKVARKTTPPKLYGTLQDAVAARMHSVTTYPGEQTISVEAATQLVSRGTYLVSEGAESETEVAGEASGPVRFRHDPRLVLPTFQYHTSEQVLSYAQGITARTLLLSGERGWPAGSAQEELDQRKRVLTEKGLLTHLTLPGSHHLHIDPDAAPLVAVTIADFLVAPDKKDASCPGNF